MRNIILSVIFSSVAIFAQAEIIIIHEKIVDGNWVMALTTVQANEKLDDVYAEIIADPDLRLGDTAVIFGGTRLKVEEVSTPGKLEWKSTPNIGEVVIFWNVTGSIDPADYYSQRFDSIAAAETFINMAITDPTINLWDNRPFLVSREYTRVQSDPTVRYVLTQP